MEEVRGCGEKRRNRDRRLVGRVLDFMGHGLYSPWLGAPIMLIIGGTGGCGSVGI